MTDMIGNLRRGAPRFRITKPEALRVTVTKNDNSFEAIQTELVNISVGGAKFKSNQSVTVNEVVSVKIDVDQPGQAISVSGEVRWIAPLDGDEWWLGCAFKPSIPHEVLNQLARQGILERREHVRQRISLPVTVQWQLEYEPTTVMVVDYSAGGLCLVSKVERGPGERLMLKFELDDGREVQVRASTRWEVCCDEGFLIGCEFIDPRDFLLLNEFLEARELLESDLCDPVTPRNVWTRLMRPPRPVKGSVVTAKRKVLQPLKEPASWLMIGGTTLLLLILALSNQLRSLEDSSRPGESQTFLTSIPSSVESMHGKETLGRGSDGSGETVPTEPNRNWLGPETLTAIDRLRVGKETSALVGEAVSFDDLRPPANEFTRSTMEQQFESESPRHTVKSPTWSRPGENPSRGDRSSMVRFVRRGRTFYRQGEYDRATDEFVRAASADPYSPLVRYFLAASQYNQGQLHRARHSINRAVALEVERPIADWPRLLQEFSAPVGLWVERTKQEVLAADR